MSIKKNHNKKEIKAKYVMGEDEKSEELEYLEKIVLGGGNDVFDQESDSDHSSNEDKSINNLKSKIPAWVDEDEENGVKCKRQSQRENKFTHVSKRPKWATPSSAAIKQDKILSKSGNLLKKSSSLDDGHLNFKKLKDLNCATYTEGPISVIKFHPKSTVAIVGGKAGVLSIMQVDGIENTKLQSIKFNKFPISCAGYVKNAEEIVLGSRFHKYFYIFNLMTGKSYYSTNYRVDNISDMRNFVVSPDDKIMAVQGKFGKIHVLSASTRENIDSLKMNCDVNALCFNQDGSRLYSYGSDGEIYVWDMKSLQCILKFYDDGCLQGTAIAASSNDAFLACGSSSGIVNLYDIQDIMLNKFNPIKSFQNLLQPVKNVLFNPTSDILAMSSISDSKGIKLSNLYSMNVYWNFPPQQNNSVFQVNCFDFSPNSGYFAVGDNRKVAHLYRLDNFGNY